MIRTNRYDYNSAIQGTAKEQLLANVVRLKDNDLPVFLDVSSVVVQTQVQGSLTGKLTFPDGELGSTLQYQETPTVTYTPLQGDALVKQLLLPLDPATIVNLYHSDWRLRNVLFLTLDRLTPKAASFDEATQVIQELDDLHALDLTVATFSSPAKDSLPKDDTKGPPKAPNLGVLTIVVDPTVSEDKAKAEPLAKRLNELMGRGELAGSGTTSYFLKQTGPMVEPLQAKGTQERRKGRKAPPQAGKPQIVSGDYTRLRSPIGVLKHAANDANIMDSKGTSDPTHNLEIVRGTPPGDAYASAKVDGAKYYIRNDDYVSKLTFALLYQLLAMQSSPQGASPLLTIPTR